MFMTQQEWASGGLVVSNEVVQIPYDLVGGLGVSNDGNRVIISNVLSQDMFFKKTVIYYRTLQKGDFLLALEQNKTRQNRCKLTAD